MPLTRDTEQKKKAVPCAETWEEWNLVSGRPQISGSQQERDCSPWETETGNRAGCLKTPVEAGLCLCLDIDKEKIEGSSGKMCCLSQHVNHSRGSEACCKQLMGKGVEVGGHQHFDNLHQA